MIPSRFVFLSSAAVAVIAGAGSAAAQQATDAAPAQAAATGQPAEAQTDIVVTAQKRNERIIDVPVQVSTIAAEDLTNQNLVRLSDFYNRIPGLQYSGQRTSNLSIRGITSGGATAATVALLVDDVPFGGTTNAGQPPLPDFDAGTLERIEVLRGPQGTLYGASSLGGLIKYVLKAPSTTDFSGSAEVGANTVKNGGDGYSARGSVNVPILSDRVGVLVSGFYREDPAFLRNAYPGIAKTRNVNTREAWGGRAALLLKPTDTLTVTLSALRQKLDTVNSDLAVTSGGVPICVACTTGGTAATRALAPTTFEPVYGDLTIRALDSIGDSKFALYTARGELDLGEATLTSISAWGRADNVLTNDVTAVFGGLLRPRYGAASDATIAIANADQTHKFSQEVRVGNQGSTIDWLIGGFYTVEHASTNQTLLLNTSTGSPIATPFASRGPSTYREYAGFGDVTWHATDRFDVQIGGRYARNRQNSSAVVVVDTPAQAIYGPSGTTIAASRDNAFTWLVAPTYHFSPDLMAYARIASGYRPGGPNLGQTTTSATFGSDSVVNYEIGTKGYAIPKVLSFDVALFQIDWKDIQLQNTNSVTQLTFLTNGGKARSRGIEAAATLRPWRGMSIDANATATDAVLAEDLPNAASTSGLKGAEGDRLPFTARFTTNLSVQQDFDLSNSVSAFVGGNFSHIGNRYAGFNTNAANATRPRILMPAYSLVDLRAGVRFDRDWLVNLYVRNLFDKRGISVANNRNGTNVPTALFVQPMTLGATISRNF